MAKEKGGIAKRVYALAEPIATECGVSLWDVRYEKEGSGMFLRIILDKPDDYITIDDCENVSRALSDKLDEEDFIPDSYHLQVSSPGIDRALRTPEHFAAYLGKPVTLKLIRPFEGQREFKGTLTDYHDGEITILCEGGELTALENECAFVRSDDGFDW